MSEIKEPKTQYEKVNLLIADYTDKNNNIENIEELEELVEKLLRFSPRVEMWNIDTRRDPLEIRFDFKVFCHDFYIYHFYFQIRIREIVANYINVEFD